MDIKSYIESGILETYLLGECTAQQAKEIAIMASLHTEIQAELTLQAQAMEMIAEAMAVQPSKDLKKNIMQAIDATPNQTPAPIPIVNMPTNGVAVQHAASEPQLKLNRWLAAACAIMAATLLASILMMGKQNAALSQQLAQLQTQTQSAELATKSLYGEVRSLKNSFYQVSASNYQIVKMVGLPISKQSNSTIFWDKDTKEVKIYASNLPTPAANEQYQLWAIVGGAPVSLGVFDPNDSALQNMQNISNPQAFAVTLEKRGGSTTPTMDKMYVIGNV
jgi:hypothetical protein